MDTRKILAELRTERDRINQAIAALEAIGSEPARGTQAKPGPRPTRRRRRHMSAAGRKRLSEMMKQRWAERRKKAKQ
jgi:hypothetical protein